MSETVTNEKPAEGHIGELVKERAAAIESKIEAVAKSAPVEAVVSKVEAAVSDPAVVAKVETVVQTAVADAPAVVDKAESVIDEVEADVSHAAAVAEAFVKGVVGKAEVSVGEVIAALVNRVHALEEKLGIVKAPIIEAPPAAKP